MIDELLDRSQRTVNYLAAKERAISKLQNWSRHNPDIGEDEMAFLNEDDLLTLATSPDEAMAALEPLIESISFKLLKIFKPVMAL